MSKAPVNVWQRLFFIYVCVCSDPGSLSMRTGGSALDFRGSFM